MAEDIASLAKSQLFTLKGDTVGLSPGTVANLAAGNANLHSAGEVVDHKYEIISLLGVGGMGAVYKAHHILLNKDVALKTFSTPDLNQDAILRFQREAQAIARLTHANIVQVFDFGVGTDNLPYYTMECLAGESLADRLAGSNHLSVEAAAEIFLQVCNGMSLAHSKNIVHRDLKPGNIFLAQASSSGHKSDTVKIVDFGLASWTTHSRDAQKLTTAGTVFGSPLYMSPEQSLGLEMTERSDIYSCGCALFETLTGSPPFRGENAFATMLQHQTKPAPVLTSQPGERRYPDRLRVLLERMLAKEPEKRIESFAAVAAELEAILKSDKNIKAGSAAPAAPANISREEITPRSKPPLSRRAALFIVAIISMGLLAAGAIKYRSAPPVVAAHDSPDSPPAVAEPEPAKKSTPASTDVSPYLQKPTSNSHGARLFHFPDQDLGELKLFASNSDSSNNIVRALGEVYVPPGIKLHLTAGPALAKNPQLFDRFGPMDLDELALSYNENCFWKDIHIKHVSRLTGLTWLSIDNADVNDDAFDDLNKLSNLRFLSLKYTLLTDPKISMLAVLPELGSFRASGLKRASATLAKLKGSRSIKYLTLDSCMLTDGNMETIATMPELRNLLISKNKEITDRGLRSISNLSHLSELRIDGTAVTPACIETLRQMQSLDSLHIDSFENRQNIKLSDAVPRCKIQLVDMKKIGSAAEDLMGDLGGKPEH